MSPLLSFQWKRIYSTIYSYTLQLLRELCTVCKSFCGNFCNQKLLPRPFRSRSVLCTVEKIKQALLPVFEIEEIETCLFTVYTLQIVHILDLQPKTLYGLKSIGKSFPHFKILNILTQIKTSGAVAEDETSRRQPPFLVTHKTQKLLQMKFSKFR